MKPSEFYVGVLDFFAILLPGAIAVAIMAPRYSGNIVGELIVDLSGESSRWAAFLVCAYFAGHLVFLIGSYVDRVYNIIREKFTPYDNESAYQCAKRIRDSFIGEADRKALNPYQWSRSVLMTIAPVAAEDVHRLEADSKFFRSLLVVCAFAALEFFWDGHVRAATVALALMIPCFARYYERRLKSTTQAYIHIVALQGIGKLKGSEKAASE